jgi:ADP-heptose:LPS heptosyltransferase
VNRSSQDALGGGPAIDWAQVRRVLLVRLRSIGDTVLMTPCLQALNEWQPGIEIGVVTEPLAAPVLQGHPLVDHLFVTGKSAASRLGLVTRLRRQRFDLAFNLHGGTTAMMLTAVSGARHTIAYRGQRGSWLLNKRAPAPTVIFGREHIHSVEQQLALLKWAGVSLPDSPRLSIATDSNAAASVRARLVGTGMTASTLASVRFAIVAPGAAFDSKRWANRGFAAVIDHLDSRWQLESLVIAGPGQERIATEVAKASRAHPRTLLTISLAELTALVGNFGCVFVGNDSGPMHIAAALGCPLVAVFGSSNPDVWHPWTDTAYRVLGGQRGVPDSGVRGAIDRVEVEQVLAAVDEVLESAATRTT